MLLKPEQFASYVAAFNTMEDENVVNLVPNAQAWEWMAQNVPLFECPDKQIEQTFYYRWWTYRKHLKQTPVGYVVTEFLTPVKHAGAYNTISCALGHHLAEGRWLHNQKYLDEYVRFWFRGNAGKPQPHFHKFSSWAQTAIYERSLVSGDKRFVQDLLPDLMADYQTWEQEQQNADGLFWQFDVRDGMEESISGSRTQKNARPTINSYMFGNAQALATLCRSAGKSGEERIFARKADELKRRTQERLWDEDTRFFKVRLAENDQLSDARELLGYIPWRFGLPSRGRESAWAQITEEKGFRAPGGLTTAERRHPRFRSHGCCKCEWDGAVWPFATSQTLEALARVLREYAPGPLTTRDWLGTFLTYARSQQRGGKPYIGEYLDEKSGQWIKGDERSRYYNHSTFADLVVTGIAGLCPRPDETIEIHPLLPPRVWDYFCLDRVPYHGRLLTIFWDATGRRYGRGQGLQILVDGKSVARSPRLARLTS